MSRSAEADRVASLFQSRFLRNYIRSKIATDPLYEAVAKELRGHELPLLDLGCGVGVMEFYLRETGFTAPIVGVDHDEPKIAAANRLASRYAALRFETADAGASIAPGSSVLLLDLLHYFSGQEQAKILDDAAEGVPAGGVVIVRDGIRDGSLRYRLTYAAEVFARMSGWLKARRLHFPTRDSVAEPFVRRGYSIDIRPLWGRTPFNNYLFVFRRPVGGTTKS